MQMAYINQRFIKIDVLQINLNVVKWKDLHENEGSG